MSPAPTPTLTTSPTRVARLAPNLAPGLAAALTGVLAYQVLGGLRGPSSAGVLARALPPPLAELAAQAAAQPIPAALLLAAAPVLAWLALAAWAARVPGVSAARARGAVGWVWAGSALAGAWALAARVSGPRSGLAALGYCLTWPALGSLGVALVLRRARALQCAAWMSAAVLAALLARVLPLGWPDESSWAWSPMLAARPPEALAEGAAWVVGAWLWMLALSRLESKWPRRWATVTLVLVPLMLARGAAQFAQSGPDRHAAVLAGELAAADPRISPGPAGLRPPGWPLLHRAASGAGDTPAGAAVADAAAWALGADRDHADALASDAAGRPLARGEANGLWLLVGLVLALLMAIPAGVYFLARAHEGPRISYRAAGLAAVLAAPLLFFPGAQVAYAAGFLAAAGAWVRSEPRGRWPWALAAGAGVALLAAFSPANLILLLLLALQSLASWKRRRAPVRTEIGRALALLAPLAAAAALGSASGDSPGAGVWASLARHHHAIAPRGWALWTLLNPLDFLLLMGPPAAVWLLRAVPWWHHPAAARRLRMDPEGAVLGAAILTVLALDLCGLTRGEAGRLWLGCMPLLVAGGAGLWRERRRAEWCWLTGMCVVLLVALKGLYVFVRLPI